LIYGPLDDASVTSARHTSLRCTTTPSDSWTLKAGDRRDTSALARPRKTSPRRSSNTSPQVDEHLTVTTLNIGAAAVARAQQLLRWLRRRASDVLVLTETSAGAGSHLIANGLQASGYEIFWQTDPRDRGVMVATKRPVLRVIDIGELSLPHRVAAVVLDTEPQTTIIGVYVPSRDRSDLKVTRKRVFIESLLDLIGRLDEHQRAGAMLVGDYNVVSRRHEPPLRGYFPFEYDMLDALDGLGLKAGHELRPGRRFPHSWVGRAGAGYLYDYVHLGPALHRRIEQCRYLDHPRVSRLTDHAGVTVSCRVNDNQADGASCSRDASYTSVS
jgi:exodeoxyribonuclease III